MTVRQSMPIALALIGALVLGAGYWLGNGHVTVRSGMGYAGDSVMSVLVDDWTYAIPAGENATINWFDASGSLHDRGRPDCLPKPGQTGAVTFGTVNATVAGLSWRPVVWVDCRPR